MLKMRDTSEEKYSWLFNCLKGQSLFRVGIVAGVCMFMFACSTPRNITYFKDIADTLDSKEVTQAVYKTPTIQVDDILQVSIQTLDPAATTLLNQQNTASWPIIGNSSTSAVAPNTNISGYLVDKDGYIVLPLVGKVMVKGLTTMEVRESLRTKAAEFYKDPVVNVRYANFKITILGEVAKPSTYMMPNEKVTLLDALGIAGDLTIFGKRENVLLIREKDGKKEFARFNLNDSKLFASPYFYLQQGDVVYVEPNKSKVASTDMAQVKRISIMASVLSLLIVVASRVNF
ncbi:polysaccharide biosynthesis/export family protein [Chitinophaga defluvii]|uniref:Polysaccharide biosynthesis/export family protein n=1 Tax=Chitinophaga defluvii TaxID=3163343 RepID=A0ABV2T0M3_9BACT